MTKLTPSVTLSVLLLFAATHGTAAQTAKPVNGESDGGQRQTNTPEKESRSGARIKGRVTEGGRPVPDASIMIFPVNVAGNMQSAITSVLRPVTSDADGNFEATGLRPGAYTISASAPGYVSSEQDSKAYYRPGDTATLTLVKGGVITGKVTNSSGDPLVGALMRAVMIRDTDEKPYRARGNLGSQVNDSMAMLLGPFKTDDRGVYRIYGLAPGYYQVAAGGRSGQGISISGASPYDGDAPTYYPSSTIDTAAEVTVAAGQEAANIDIRYRENHGHSVGGTVTVSTGPTPQAVSVLLTRSGNGVIEATAVVLAGRAHFGFDNLLDGEYLVTAMGSSGNPALGPSTEALSASVSQPARVTVKGADVAGINLIIEPLASIAGRIEIERLQDAKQKPACKEIRPAPIEASVLSARDERKETTVDPMSAALGGFVDTTPDEKGEFLIGLLRPGIHRIEVGLPSEHLYVRTIILPQADPKARPIDAAKTGLKLNSGDKLKGIVVTLAEGAAALAGKVVTGADNKPPQMKMRVHLVPAEPDAADAVLRYFEAEVAADGSFAVTNLAPGKYWLVGREVSEDKLGDADHKPAGWDPATRTALKFEGEGSKTLIELAKCQFVSEYHLKYIPLTKPSKPPEK